LSATQAKSEKAVQTANGDIATLIAQRIQSLGIAELAELLRLQADNDIIGVEEADRPRHSCTR
jgi:hypothetical protein